jgi:hypothetical protein
MRETTTQGFPTRETDVLAVLQIFIQEFEIRHGHQLSTFPVLQAIVPSNRPQFYPSRSIPIEHS